MKPDFKTIAFVPAQTHRSGASSKDGSPIYGKEQFRYDQARNVYQCPGGAELKRRSRSGASERPTVLYDNVKACRQCPCAASTRRHRTVARGPHEAAAQRAAVRWEEGRQEMMASRRESVEHVFGTLHQWYHDVFLLKGLEKVRGEFSLSVLCYNLRRVLGMETVAELLSALKKPVTA